MAAPSRLLSVLLVLGLTAAACGGSDDSEQSTASPSASASPSSSEPADEASDESASEPETEDEAEPEDGVDTETDEEPEAETEPEEPAGPRVVETPLGAFEVPADPQRIVITDAGVALPLAFDLGVDVYGTWDAGGLGSPDRTLLTQEEWDSLELVGSGINPNVELLAASEPDLVIHQLISEDDVDLIQPFTAVVPFENSLSWRDDARLIADALDRVDELETLIADYDERAAALAQRIDDEIGDPSVALLRVRPDSIRVHTNLHFSGELLTDMGLRVPDDYVNEPAGSRNESTLLVQLSAEQIGELADADYILLMPVGTFVQSQDDVNASLDALQSGALWQTLPAVQDGRVTVVGAHWFFGGLRAANLALDDVESLLFG
ncbi:MAG: ABC transporter substrate-binding protein [Actinomycetota bacterium]